MTEKAKLIPPKKIQFSPAKVVKSQTEETITTESKKITSLYGLDADLLRSLNMGDLIDEKAKQISQPKETDELSNLNMDQMRQTYGNVQKQSRVRLREIVSAYKVSSDEERKSL